MKKIIDDLLYDTSTAKELCDVTPAGRNELSGSDFDFESTTLYQTTSGRFFVAGEGGARSRWSHTFGNTTSAGKGLEAVTLAEARNMVSHFGSVELFEATFGKVEEA